MADDAGCGIARQDEFADFAGPNRGAVDGSPRDFDKVD
jgi:hypothetical protein